MLILSSTIVRSNIIFIAMGLTKVELDQNYDIRYYRPDKRYILNIFYVLYVGEVFSIVLYGPYCVWSPWFNAKWVLLYYLGNHYHFQGRREYPLTSPKQMIFKSGSGRIHIHLGPWIRIRIQGYNIKGKAEFNQQIFGFLCWKLYFSSLKLKKLAYL